MEIKEILDDFYVQLKHFLLNSGLESRKKIKGYSSEEIVQLEANRGIELPYAYKAFLKYFAKGNPLIFDHQDYSFSGIQDAVEVAEYILRADKTELPVGAFVFTQWQGYNFDYFILGNDNPEVILYIEGDGSPDSHEIHKSKSFTDWLCEMIKVSLNLRHQLDGLQIVDLLSELERIKQLPERTS